MHFLRQSLRRLFFTTGFVLFVVMAYHASQTANDPRAVAGVPHAVQTQPTFSAGQLLAVAATDKEALTLSAAPAPATAGTSENGATTVTAASKSQAAAVDTQHATTPSKKASKPLAQDEKGKKTDGSHDSKSD